jgi:ATP-dependent DNA helicase RecQ
VYLRSYFGDLNAAPCGHCDNCLKSRNSRSAPPTNEEFLKIQELLTDGIKNISELVMETGLKREKVDQILRHLIKEEKVTTVNTKPGCYTVN